MHTRERQREQLEMAEISAQPAPDLSWLTATPIAFDLPRNFALLVPGAAPHRPAKRWPAQHFARLASELDRRGLTPVIIGTEAESPIARQIRAACANAVDLTGRTGIAEIAAIAAKAMLAVGNDTGPMHLAAAVGCPCIVLFSADSDPALTSPRGPGGVWPTILREDDLADLPPSRVLDRVADVLAWA
jgi:ADP-heptose:LPS heptosyltransferase